MKKRFLSVLLALVLVVAMVPVTASADYWDEDKDEMVETIPEISEIKLNGETVYSGDQHTEEGFHYHVGYDSFDSMQGWRDCFYGIQHNATKALIEVTFSDEYDIPSLYYAQSNDFFLEGEDYSKLPQNGVPIYNHKVTLEFDVENHNIVGGNVIYFFFTVNGRNSWNHINGRVYFKMRILSPPALQENESITITSSIDEEDMWFPFSFTPSTTGWYTFTSPDASLVEHCESWLEFFNGPVNNSEDSIYDDSFPLLSTPFGANLFLVGGKTYFYFATGHSYSLPYRQISVKKSEFRTLTQGTRLSLPMMYHGGIGNYGPTKAWNYATFTPSRTQAYTFTLEANNVVHFEDEWESYDYTLDNQMIVFDENGNSVGLSRNKASKITWTGTLQAGHSYTIGIQAYGGADYQTHYGILSVATNSTAPVTSFIDVKESAWYYTPVQWAVANGVTSGTSDTTFSPGNQCTRAQAVTFLWNAKGQPEPKSTKNPFTDVKSTAWYYKAVLWAVENGITSGTSATTFSPNSTCTRAQIVTFFHNYAGKPAASGKNPFTDVKSTAWYYQPVLWAVSEGVTAGLTPTTFGPTNTCTRGQIVTFLYNYLGKE